MFAMTDDRERRQRGRNRALLVVLIGVAVLFYVMALVKMGAF
jgi:hypothetical protein